MCAAYAVGGTLAYGACTLRAEGAVAGVWRGVSTLKREAALGPGTGYYVACGAPDGLALFTPRPVGPGAYGVGPIARDHPRGAYTAVFVPSTLFPSAAGPARGDYAADSDGVQVRGVRRSGLAGRAARLLGGAALAGEAVVYLRRTGESQADTAGPTTVLRVQFRLEPEFL